VGETNTQLVSWHWTGDDESIVPMVTSIVDTTILPIMNASIACLPAPSQNIRALWGCREELNRDGGLQARNVTPIIANIPAAHGYRLR